MPQSLSKKALVESYFTKVAPNEYKCKCGRKRKQKDGAGYSNLLNHIQSDHPDHAHHVMETNTVITNSAGMAATRKANNIYCWIDWIITEAREFSFPDSDLVKKYTNLDPVTGKTLQEYMTKLEREVENSVASSLPTKFGLIIDGWIDGSTHYLGVFAVYEHEGTFLILLQF